MLSLTDFLKDHPGYIDEVFPSTNDYNVSSDSLVKVVKPFSALIGPQETITMEYFKQYISEVGRRRTGEIQCHQTILFPRKLLSLPPNYII